MTRFAALCAAALAVGSCSGPPASEPRAQVIQFDQTSADLIAQGGRVAAVLGCSGCHGADLQGEDWGDPEFGVLWTSNLTRAAAGWSDGQLAATIRSGRRPDGSELWGMPSHIFTELSDRDMAAIVAFVRSLQAAGPTHPRPAFAAGGQAEIAEGLFKSSPDEIAQAPVDQPPHVGAAFERGRYLVRATCAECHGLNLRGGQPHPGAAFRPDLRMVAAYDDAQFDRLLTEGIGAGDRNLGLMTEVAVGRFSHFTPAERRAVHDYLREVAARETAPG